MTSRGIKQGLRVIVVEDEGLVAAGLKCLLEEIGHQVQGSRRSYSRTS